MTVRTRIDGFDKLLLLCILWHAYTCPFTKVEESFNMQAIHDIMNFKTDIDKYDHLEFPGVVPRTFVGSLVVAVISYPFHLLCMDMGLPNVISQYVVRFVVGFLSWAAFLRFRSGIASRFSNRASQFATLLLAVQFHLPFYMSRTLPNTFALMGTAIALGDWLKGHPLRCLLTITFFMVIFRCDLLLLLAPTTLVMLLSGEVPFFKTLFSGIAVAALALGTTVLIDSYFWKTWLWPEGQVLFFNTVENRSSEWGTQPFHWYPTVALGKSLHIQYIWLLLGLLGLHHPLYHLSKVYPIFHEDVKVRDSKVNHEQVMSDKLSYWKLIFKYSFFGDYMSTLWYYFTPAVVFIVLYSLLPHKELRFLFPVFPLLLLPPSLALDGLIRPDTDSTTIAMYLFGVLDNGDAYDLLNSHKSANVVSDSNTTENEDKHLEHDNNNDHNEDHHNKHHHHHHHHHKHHHHKHHHKHHHHNSHRRRRHRTSHNENDVSESNRDKYFSAQHFFRVQMSKKTSKRVFFYEMACSFGLLFTLIISLSLANMSNKVSRANYPGGVSMDVLINKHLKNHNKSDASNVRVHIDVMPAMTGITRFLHEENLRIHQISDSKMNSNNKSYYYMEALQQIEADPTKSIEHCLIYANSDKSECSVFEKTSEFRIEYSKEENLQDAKLMEFDYLVTDKEALSFEGFDRIDTIKGFDKISYRLKYNYYDIAMGDKVFIYKKSNNICSK